MQVSKIDQQTEVASLTRFGLGEAADAAAVGAATVASSPD